LVRPRGKPANGEGVEDRSFTSRLKPVIMEKR
jgi:hypothetical protein